MMTLAPTNTPWQQFINSKSNDEGPTLSALRAVVRNRLPSIRDQRDIPTNIDMILWYLERDHPDIKVSAKEATSLLMPFGT